MVQPQEQKITLGSSCGEQDGGNNYSHCPLEQWFQLLQFSAFESNKGRKDFVSPCGCADTNFGCFSGLAVWSKLCDLGCQAVILLNKNKSKIKLLLYSCLKFFALKFRTPEIVFSIIVAMTFFFTNGHSGSHHISN